MGSGAGKLLSKVDSSVVGWFRGCGIEGRGENRGAGTQGMADGAGEHATAMGWHSGSSYAALDTLLSQMVAMKQTVLEGYATLCGAQSPELERAIDADEPKAEIIRLILRQRPRTGRASRRQRLGEYAAGAAVISTGVHSAPGRAGRTRVTAPGKR